MQESISEVTLNCVRIIDHGYGAERKYELKEQGSAFIRKLGDGRIVMGLGYNCVGINSDALISAIELVNRKGNSITVYEPSLEEDADDES